MRLELGRAVSIVARTLPFILFRLVVWAAVWVVAALCLGILGLTSLLFGWWSFWVGLAAILGLVYHLGLAPWVWFQLVRLPGAQRMGLVVELVTDGLPPSGVAQVGWARRRIVERFDSVAAFHAYTNAVGRALRDMLRRVLGVTVPLPALETQEGANAPARLVELSLARVEDVMFGYALIGDDTGSYERTERAITRYCRNGRALLQAGVVLTLLSWAGAAAVFTVCLVVFGVVAAAFPHTWEVARFILFLSAAFLAGIVKGELLDPIANTALLLRFLRTADSSERDVEYNARLGKASSAFRAIKRKAGSLTGTGE